MTFFVTVGIPAAGRQAYAADRAAEVIHALGIMETDRGNTDIGTDIVNRARFAQMLVNLSTVKDEVTGESNVSLFSDVKKNYWAAGYIKAAVLQGWMSGYLNGAFKPEQGISLQEAVYGILRLLGYGENDFGGSKANAVMNLYKTKKLDQSISKTRTQYLTVDDCIHLFYNTLNTTTRDGKVYASVLGYTVNSNGELDYLSLINTGITGPILVTGNWKSKLPFPVIQAKLYKYGEEGTYSDIKDYDVIYYSESFKTIWIYDDKVTGTIDSVNPDYSNPQSVTVAGSDYSFTDSEVALKFSSMGDIKAGSLVTLLLDRDGRIVDVLSIDEYNTTITGVVLETGTRLEERQNGVFVKADYVTFVDAAGNKHTQDYDSDTLWLAKGAVVRVAYTDGVASVSEIVQESRDFGNNIFSKDGSALGNTALASNVKILDLKDGNYINIYPERLAGTVLGGSTIYYCELNDKGEISQLILNNVTGDLASYGIFTGITYTASDKVNYNYIVGNSKGSLATGNLSELNTDVGPKGFTFEDNVLTEAYSLSEVNVTAIGAATVQYGNTKFPMAENCGVYLLLDGEYIPSTLDKVSDLTKYNIKAYYDKPDTYGGRIRVILAEGRR
jgi:hypothetical protein